MEMRRGLGGIVAALALIAVVSSGTDQALGAEGAWEILRCNSDGTWDCAPGCTWEVCCDDEP